MLSNLFRAAKPTQPHVACEKENKSFQDKLTLLPGAALSVRLGHNLQPAKKKSDLVKKKGKVLPRDDGKHSGYLQLSPEGACLAPVLCWDSIQISLLEMGAVDCFRLRFALLMCSQPRSFLENSKYLLWQHRRVHTPPSATRFPRHGLRSPFSHLCHPFVTHAHGSRAASAQQGFGCGQWSRTPEPVPLPSHGSCSSAGTKPAVGTAPAGTALQSLFLHDNCTLLLPPKEREGSAQQHHSVTEEEAWSGTAGIPPTFPRVNFQISLDRQGPASP